MPLLFLEVRNVIKFPFSGWGIAKLANRWMIAVAVSVGWSCVILHPEFSKQVNFFYYGPIFYIGKDEENNTLNK
jgi:hypothetical protein